MTDFPLDMIGIKKVQGGSLADSQLVAGVAFKKTFSYAGFEMQPKKYTSPKIALLNVELELKAERTNAEVRVDNVEVSERYCECKLYNKSTRVEQAPSAYIFGCALKLEWIWGWYHELECCCVNWESVVTFLFTLGRSGTLSPSMM